jgi:hypothetical protein
VKYELGFYIPEDDILHSDRREYRKSYIPYIWLELLSGSVTAGLGGHTLE